MERVLLCGQDSVGTEEAGVVWGEGPGEGCRTVWGEGKIVCGVSGTKESNCAKEEDGGDATHEEGRDVQVTSPKARLWSQSSSISRGHES